SGFTRPSKGNRPAGRLRRLRQGEAEDGSFAHLAFAPDPASVARDHALHRRQTDRSEEHTSELQSRGHLVCRLLLEKKKKRCSRCSFHRNPAPGSQWPCRRCRLLSARTW